MPEHNLAPHPRADGHPHPPPCPTHLARSQTHARQQSHQQGGCPCERLLLPPRCHGAGSQRSPGMLPQAPRNRPRSTQRGAGQQPLAAQLPAGCPSPPRSAQLPCEPLPRSPIPAPATLRWDQRAISSPSLSSLSSVSRQKATNYLILLFVFDLFILFAFSSIIP